MTSFERHERGNPVAIKAQAQGLPQMNEAVVVWDMEAAASLDAGFAAGTATHSIKCASKNRRKRCLFCFVFYSTKSNQSLVSVWGRKK